MDSSNPYQAPDKQAVASKTSRFASFRFLLSTAIPVYLIFQAWRRVSFDLDQYGRIRTSIISCLLAAAWLVYWAYSYFIRPRILHRRYHEYLGYKVCVAYEKVKDRQLDEAIAELDQVVWCRECEAWVTEAIDLRGMIHRLLGNYGLAKDDAVALYEIDPSNLEYVATLASILTGAPDDSVRDIASAEELVNYGLSAGNDSDANFLRIQTAIHAERGEFVEAIDCYERAMETGQKHERFEENLARLKSGMTLRFDTDQEKARYFELLDKQESVELQ